MANVNIGGKLLRAGSVMRYSGRTTTATVVWRSAHRQLIVMYQFRLSAGRLGLEDVPQLAESMHAMSPRLHVPILLVRVPIRSHDLSICICDAVLSF